MRRLGIAPKVMDILGKFPTINEWFATVTERFKIYSGSGTPTSDQVPEGQWVVYKDTSTGDIDVLANDGGAVINLTPAGGGGGGTGDVVGPAVSVNNHVVFFNGITGKLIKDSGLTLAGTNTGDQTITLTGDVTGSGTGSFATTIAPASVTYSKMQNISAISKLLGRGSGAGVGSPEEITLGSGLTMTGTTLAATGTGDVVGPAGAVNNNVVFFDGVTGKLVKDSGLALTGTNTGDQTITLTGDVTGTGTGSFAATIGNNIVTYAKMQDVSATSRILGRVTAGAGDPEELTAANVKTFLTYSATDVGLGSVTNDAQTKAAIVPNTVPSSAQVLVGNGGGTAYAPVSISGDVTITSAGVATIANTDKILANVTLGVAGTSLASGTITARKFLRIEIWIQGYAGSDTASLQFNGAAGTAYRYRWLTCASGATTFSAGLLATSTDRIKIAAANTTNPRLVVAHVRNFSAVTEKMVKFESQFGTGSAGTQDTIDLGQGAWVSGGATQITSVSLVSTSNMTAGTQMVIYGWD